MRDQKDFRSIKNKIKVVNMSPKEEAPREDETQEAIEASLNAKLEKKNAPEVSQYELNIKILQVASEPGRVVSFTGNESPLLAVVHAQNHGKRIAVIDCMGLFDIGWSEKCGLDISNTIVVFPQDMNECVQMIEDLQKEVDLIMLDSAHAFMNHRIMNQAQLINNQAILQRALEILAISKKCSIMGTAFGLMPPRANAA